MKNLIEVSRKEFYDYVNPRDICVHCVKTSPIAVAVFETRSRVLVGKQIHDYDNEKKSYFLREDLIKKALP